MEICGGQTHAIVKFGLDELLPKEIEMVHGPGCPVCVTPLELIDKAVQIAQRPEVISARSAICCGFLEARPTCSASRHAAAMCGFSIRRWMH